MKKIVQSFSTFFCLLILLAACSKTVDIQLTSEVKVFFSDNKDKTIQLKAGDAAYDVLKDWLVSHKGGWLTASGQFAGGVYILSGDYGIQITETKVIVYSTKGDKPQALYAQQITRSEFKNIKRAGAIAHTDGSKLSH